SGLGWDDWQGGLINVGILGMFIVQQVTLSVNSLAHWLGSSPFEDRLSPRDRPSTAVLAFRGRRS
ncbi:hypothetical protein BO86DRAFT_309641, partial [Aspergillus japonicus CBS 114.51]